MMQNPETYFVTRRTVRRYTDRPVDTAMIDRLLAQAANAPTTGNMQLYTAIVTDTPEGVAALAPAHFSQPAATGAPVLVTFCADFHRFTRWCRLRQADPAYGNLQSLMSAMFDATIFAQQFVTLAEMNGLGTCYLGTTTYNARQIAATLKLPELVVPVLTVSVGWPAEPGEETGRLPAAAVVSHGSYNDPSDDELLDLYAEKEARDDSRRFVEENGKQTLAQVFTDVRYPRANNEFFSKEFAEFLTSVGFL